MKLLVRLLVLTSLFLFGGYSYLHAHSHHRQSRHVSCGATLDRHKEVDAVGTGQPSFPVYSAALPNHNPQEKVVCEEECETERVESSAGQKYLQLSDYFTVFRPLALAVTAKNNIALQSGDHIACPSAGRYILLHVIRI